MEFIPTFEFQIGQEKTFERICSASLSLDICFTCVDPIRPRIKKRFALSFRWKKERRLIYHSRRCIYTVVYIYIYIVTSIVILVPRDKEERLSKWSIYDSSSFYQISKHHFHQRRSVWWRITFLAVQGLARQGVAKGDIGGTRWKRRNCRA